MTFERFIAPLFPIVALLALSCGSGRSGVPDGSSVELLASYRLDSLDVVPRFVRGVDSDNLYLVSVKRSSNVRIDRLDTNLALRHSFELEVPWRYATIKVYPLPGEKLLLFGISAVEVTEKKKRVSYQAVLIDVAGERIIDRKTIDPRFDTTNMDWHHALVTLSPERTRALVTLWDYRKEDTVAFDAILLDMSSLMVVDSLSRSFATINKGRSISSPFFLDESTIAVVRSFGAFTTNKLIVDNLTDSIQSSLIAFPDEMAEERVLPAWFGFGTVREGKVKIAVALDDDTWNVKGLLILDYDRSTGTVRSVGSTDFSHERLDDHKIGTDLYQARPTALLEPSDGSIHVVMEVHANLGVYTYWRTTAKRSATRSTLLTHATGFNPVDNQMSYSGMEVVVRFDSAGSFDGIQPLTDNEFVQADEEWSLRYWHQSPELLWYETLGGVRGSIMGGDDDPRLMLFRNHDRLRSWTYDPGAPASAVASDIFTINSSSRFIPAESIWLDPRRVIISIQSSRKEEGYTLYLLRLRS